MLFGSHNDSYNGHVADIQWTWDLVKYIYITKENVTLGIDILIEFDITGKLEQKTNLRISRM